MSKNIVVCYDGTRNEYREHNTNVVKTFEAIVRDDDQVAFYDPGVGTFSIFGRRVGRWFGLLLGSLFGYGIRENVEDGYEYLMNRYEPGDRVFLFGFSRGAYTARALAGMIHQFGILQKGSKNLIPYVWRMYSKRDEEKDFTVIKGFKKTFSNACKPQVIGLWDTVGTHGPNGSKVFTNRRLNPDVRYGFHAISIDEKRTPYKVILWEESCKKDDQVIEQVWFPGVHSEVGGGCSKKGECSLPDLPFAWMMDKAKAIEGGLKLKDGWQSKLSRDAGVDMHDPCKFFPWVILGWRKKREIPDRALVHQSVIDRAKKRADYSPNLPNNTSTVSTDSYTNNG